jgi:hypothetical protein
LTIEQEANQRIKQEIENLERENRGLKEDIDILKQS